MPTSNTLTSTPRTYPVKKYGLPVDIGNQISYSDVMAEKNKQPLSQNKEAIRARARRKRRREVGQCYDCSRPAVEGNVRCPLCRERARRNNEANNQKHLEQGLCLCGAKVTLGKRWCSQCIDGQAKAHRRLHEVRREKKLCTVCGLPLTQLELDTGQTTHAMDNCYPSRRVHT
jgi:hypothetical protein